MKFKNSIIKIVILAVVFVFLVCPGINPLLGDGVKASVSSMLESVKSVFSLAKLVALLAMIVGVWLLSVVVDLILNLLSKTSKHTQTVITLLISLVKYISVIAIIIWGLGILGVNTTAIFASVGVVSLIIGFGAQSLIEDTITGIFLIFENNFNVGDFIVLDDFRGRILKIGIRTVTLADAGGNIKVVNNSDIRNFQNKSYDTSVAVCDVGISYDADIRKVEAIVLPALEGIYERNTDVFVKAPSYSGVDSLGDSAVILRFLAFAKEDNIYGARRRLNRELKILFDENGIEIPFTQIVLHQGN